MQNGNPFMLAYEMGRGKVFIAAVALNDNFSNFQRHAVFVPTLVNNALHSGAFQPLFHKVGSADPILVRVAPLQQDKVLMLKGPEPLETFYYTRPGLPFGRRVNAEALEITCGFLNGYSEKKKESKKAIVELSQELCETINLLLNSLSHS